MFLHIFIDVIKDATAHGAMPLAPIKIFIHR